MSPSDKNSHWTRREVLIRGTKTAYCAGTAAAALSAAAHESNAVESPEAGVEKNKMDWNPTEFRKMVALGESTTAGGWSTSPDRCWVSQLARLISEFQSEPMELVNSGIGANVISTRSPCYEHSGKPAANERLDKHVLEHQPDLLIISYGLNDARGGTPIDLFTDELKKILHRVREQNRPVILLPGPYFMTDFTVGGKTWANANLKLFHDFNDAIRNVAQQERCLFVDLLDAYQETPWMVHYDGCHANDVGHRIVANRMFEVLAQHCSGVARRTKEAEKTSPRWRDESILRADFSF